ncbi:MAG: hypothetical protein JKX98_08355 [Alcanivoracaceae bacterium]|nr:hypothetical protein [Alcanivoracaceae bacterium]
MTFVFILTLIIIGAVAAADYIEHKIPQTKTALDFIKPHDAWIGLVSLILGIFWLLSIVISLGTRLRIDPIATLVFIVSLSLLIILGTILAQNYIKQYTGKNKSIIDFNQKMMAKFMPMKEKLGQLAIVTGLFNLLLLIT